MKSRCVYCGFKAVLLAGSVFAHVAHVAHVTHGDLVAEETVKVPTEPARISSVKKLPKALLAAAEALNDESDRDPTQPEGIIESLLEDPKPPKAVKQTAASTQSQIIVPDLEPMVPETPKLQLRARMIMKGKAPVALVEADTGGTYLLREGTAFEIKIPMPDTTYTYRYEVKKIDATSVKLKFATVDEESNIELR